MRIFPVRYSLNARPLLVIGNEFMDLLTMRSLLRAAAEIKTVGTPHTAALTGYPDHVQTEVALHEHMEKHLPSDVVFADLHNFRDFKECYSYETGDELLKFTTSLLTRFFPGDLDSFLGHTHDDNFVTICDIDNMPQVPQDRCREFNQTRVQYFNNNVIYYLLRFTYI